MEFYMSAHYEIERKFLVEIPDIGRLDLKRQLHIRQTYLKKGENGSQRRVRSINEDGITSYTYTEKVFVTHITREENEYEINEARYHELLGEYDTELTPVVKTRYCFNYAEQLFELDVYPYSDRLAIMELELADPEQIIDFPPFVNVLKDVSDDSRYSNANLASAGAFPDERNGEVGQ